ncbi:2-succinylbenzoate--CoA ligase [Paraglaciecola mesophila]|uniref:Long-chain-fatty-acid--CoA ligase n=1 Tax=Paraglaciecola mesophila TaxID=197222 RepID=A0A857JND1_9ALTE|nr:class I adenylate-forming enzyme family protein [Paraglaciecola mesophila]QHJ13575.1 2-succinylbenzoate--CoA ligase [Paraglaciecola mesophila]
MNNLVGLINEHGANANIVGAVETYTVHQLMVYANAYRQTYSHLSKQPAALVYTNAASFIVGMLAFDGYCSRLYLCSDVLAKDLDANITRITIDIADASLTKHPSSVSVVESFVGEDQEQERLRGRVTTDSQYPNVVTQWCLATSGTSGKPKWFAHTLASLTLNCKTSPRLRDLCWANLYQAYRYAGLQVLLQVLISGATLVDDDSDDLLLKMQRWVNTNVNAISATPSMWRQMLMSNHLHNIPMQRITLGGEIADQSLLDNLAKLHPTASIAHIYASTEAGVGFVVKDKLAGFPVSWLQQGVSNAQLAIDEKQHLRIKPKHELDAQLTTLTDDNGYLDTQDLVRLEGGRVIFLGRASGVINVGGNKVPPEKVESVILLVEGVLQAKVYGQPNSVLGNLVVADIVIAPNHDWSNLSRTVREQCKLLLQRFEIPVKLRKIDSLVMSPTGKLNRSDDHV